jgi:peptide/nickel transport system permease protein
MDKRKILLRTFIKNKAALVGGIIALTVTLLAVFAPLIAPYDPIEQNVYHRLAPPEKDHLLGTDVFGRDTLSRIIWGARVSISVSVSSVFIAMIIGTAFGMIAGFKGGKAESVIMRVVDVLMSFPVLIMGLMVMAVFGSGLIKLILAIAIVLTPRFVRIAHAPTLEMRQKDFIEAARALGVSTPRLLTHHILPNIFGEVLVMATLWTATAIRMEANLSFIGLGVSPPTPTWGNMIRAGVQQLTISHWLAIFPGIAILITVLSFNMLGDGLRDITDPKLYE